jgi:hypothetical protein
MKIAVRNQVRRYTIEVVRVTMTTIEVVPQFSEGMRAFTLDRASARRLAKAIMSAAGKAPKR